MTRTKTKEAQQPALFAEATTPSSDAAKSPAPSAVARKPQAKRQSTKGSEVIKFEPKQPQNMMAVMASLAANPAVDVDKMRELYRLYQETEAKQQFHNALLALDLPTINRDGKIPVSGGKALRFASFENVHKAVMKPLREAGFRMSFQPMPSPSGDGMVVECKLIRGIYEEKCVVPISTAPASRAMNSQQAIGAAIKYASRYGVMYLLNLRSEAPEDRDLDGNDPEKVKEAESKAERKNAAIDRDGLAKLDAAIKDCGVPLSTVLEKFGIRCLEDMKTGDLAAALASCANFKAEKLKREQRKTDEASQQKG